MNAADTPLFDLCRDCSMRGAYEAYKASDRTPPVDVQVKCLNHGFLLDDVEYHVIDE